MQAPTVGVDTGSGDRTVISIQTPAGKRAKVKYVEVFSIVSDGDEPDAFDVYLVMAERERNIPIQKMWDKYCKSFVKRETGLLIGRI